MGHAILHLLICMSEVGTAHSGKQNQQKSITLDAHIFESNSQLAGQICCLDPSGFLRIFASVTFAATLIFCLSGV